MKWKSLAICAAAALCAASSASAQQPTLTRGQSVAATPAARRPILTQISWWAKFGQPLEEPAGVAPAAGEPEVLNDNGYGYGYAYGPGSCDCNPPCTDQLWAGYVQMPWRCTHPQYKNRGCGLGGCGHCSDSCHACSAPAPCGCADSVGGGYAPPAAGAPAAPPAVGPPAVGPPVPAADEASVLKRPLMRSVSSGRPASAKPGIR